MCDIKFLSITCAQKEALLVQAYYWNFLTEELLSFQKLNAFFSL